MSSSKIYKNTGIKAAEPFVTDSRWEPETYHEPAAGAKELREKEVGERVFALEKEAYEKGFKAGERAGFEFGRQKAEVAFSGLVKILNELAAFRQTMYAACEKEVVELALAISRKVIRREVEIKKDRVLECVRVAMKAVMTAGEIVVRINTKDLDIVSQFKEELARYGKGVKGVVIQGDDSILRGGCIVETNYGEVDATLDSVMSEIEEKIKDAF